jgi:hypothetical protein
MASFFANYPAGSGGGGGGGGVTSLNSLTGALTLVGGTGITVTPSGSNITISSSGAAVWGSITGTISSQTDLQSEFANYALLSGATFTGQVNVGSIHAGTNIIFVGNYHVEPFEYAAGSSGTAITIALNNGSSQAITLTGNATFTLTNPQAGGIYILRLIQDGTGSRLVTWPSIKWQGGTAPILTTTAGKIDLISLYWDGTFYYGSASLDY